MMDTPVLYFLVGLFACFLGTIPFGPINLTVVKTTVDHNAARGTEVALAASLVEMAEALVAIWFGMVISNYLETNLLLRLLIALAFIGLAGFIFTRKPKPKLEQPAQDQDSFFKKGLLIAALNPQAIPFWIFALARNWALVPQLAMVSTMISFFRNPSMKKTSLRLKSE